MISVRHSDALKVDYLAKSGKVGSKPLPGLTWRITLAISVGSPDGSCCYITNVKIKFRTEQGRRCSHWRIGRRELQGFPSHLGVPPATSNERYILKEWCVDCWCHLQCIEVRVLGGKASVGSHIGQQNHLGTTTIQRISSTIVTLTKPRSMKSDHE